MTATATTTQIAAVAGRAGLVGRGLLHFLVGWIAVRIAIGNGSTDAHADRHGALAEVTEKPLGRALVLMMAFLFIGYALWRFVEAARNPDDNGALRRVGYVARGVLYTAFALAALSFARTGTRGNPSSSGEHERDVTLGLLELPGGRVLVAAVGLVVIGVGVWNGWRAVSGSYARDVKTYQLSRAARQWIEAIGFVGSLARGVAYSLAGFFVTRVAWEFDPSEPVGLDESLRRIARAPWGRPPIIAVGLGLIAFGVFQVALARYRRVLEE